MIKKLLLSTLFCGIIGFSNLKNYQQSNSELLIEKDFSIGEDYTDIEVRKSRILDSTTYSNGIQKYDKFLTSYFDNLTYNFGTNYKGSCGYVAIGMLLSYYDTYLSDTIIPEQFDVNSVGPGNDMISRRNSPGISKDPIVNPSNPSDAEYGFELSANDYYSAIVSTSNTSLHSKLIKIGAERGYYDFNDSNNPCGTNYLMRYNVLQDYFSTILNFEYGNQYSFTVLNDESNYNLSNDVRNFAISQVSSGNPVLLSVGGSSGGHVVVAYDYDSNLDKLYCHMGWNASSTRKTIEDYSFTRYKTALAINFNSLSHFHSNNYVVTTVKDNVPTNVYYCYHDCCINTVSNSGTHHYDDHFETHDSSRHKAYCACGNYVLRPHSIDPDSIYMSNGKRYGNCLHCGTFIDLGTTGAITPLP